MISMTDMAIRAVAWVVIHDGLVALERCPKKIAQFGHDTWFVPGGRIESGETPFDALGRELAEEWGCAIETARPMPVIQGAQVTSIDVADLFLMLPYAVTVRGVVPEHTLDEGTPVTWIPVGEALASPVLQVRMMVAAASMGRYSMLRDEISNAPTTWVPGLLRAAVERASRGDVFRPGGLAEFVEHVAHSESWDL